MEWLKQLVGEDNFKKLEENGTIALLKTVMGETKYIADDPTKIIPKHVFNEKLEKIKLLESQIGEYKEQLKNTGNMITDKEVKQKLLEQEAQFKSTIKEMETKFQAEQEKNNKMHLVQNALMTSGCKHPDLILKTVNLDDVIIKDDKILNEDSVILPLKDTYKVLFETKQTGTPPPKGTNPPPPQPKGKEELINKYNEAEKAGDNITMLRIQREIKSLEQ